MNLEVLPIPYDDKRNALTLQSGAGLCAYRTTEEKAKACALFAKWLTDTDRNIEFVTDTGYMPVRKDSFTKLSEVKFKSKSYKKMYSALQDLNENYKFVKEPIIGDYFPKVHKFYDILKVKQKAWKARYENGESEDVLVQECWSEFKGID